MGRKANESMGLYNTRRPREASRRKGAPQATSRRFSAIAGGALILVASLGFLWLFLHQFSPSLIPFVFPHSINAPADPLVAAGITLSTPAQGQEPRLTRQQALLLVNQMEPEAAAHNDGVTASYALFSYQGHNSAASFHDVPAWLVHYTQVSGPSPDTSADPHATSAHHDLYVFLDAKSGKELLAIWL